MRNSIAQQKCLELFRSRVSSVISCYVSQLIPSPVCPTCQAQEGCVHVYVCVCVCTHKSAVSSNHVESIISLVERLTSSPPSRI